MRLTASGRGGQAAPPQAAQLAVLEALPLQCDRAQRPVEELGNWQCSGTVGALLAAGARPAAAKLNYEGAVRYLMWEKD